MSKQAPRTYAEITQQIASLQKEAQDVLQQEVAGVIARINEAIAVYGIQPGDLRFSNGEVAKKRGRKRGSPAAAALKEGAASARKPKGSAVVRYRDEVGNTWSGRGPRPRWLREAMADGTKDLSMFAV